MPFDPFSERPEVVRGEVISSSTPPSSGRPAPPNTPPDSGPDRAGPHGATAAGSSSPPAGQEGARDQGGTSYQHDSAIPPYQPGPIPPYQDGSRVPPYQQGQGQVPPFGAPFRVHVGTFGTRGPNPQTPFGAAGGPPLLLFGRKSVLLAGLLGLLGPIGMIYATFIGSLGMTFLLFVSLLAGGGDAVGTLWILCPLWAMLAAYRRNVLLDRLGVPR